MKQLLSVLLILFSTAAFAQGNFSQVTSPQMSPVDGIRFETGDWSSVVAKAKKANKLIYVDVYTTWCGPCKVLAASVFPRKAAGDKYNPNFVNYRIDAEQGEGVSLAKQYEVRSYPTHLFIDPVTQKTVYRASGGGADVNAFNHHADVALAERADTMSIAMYEAKYRAGERSEPFLRAWLEKARRLEVPNDTIIDRYMAVAVTAFEPSTPLVAYLATQVSTLFNNAVPYILANAALFPSSDNRASLNDFFARWAQGSLDRAVRERNPVLIDTLAARLKRYSGNDDESIGFWYRSKYYTAVGDNEGAFRTSVAQADYLSAKPKSYFVTEDEKGAVQSRKMIRSQLRERNIDSTKWDELVALNLREQPFVAKSSSYQSSMNLNGISQYVFQQRRTDTSLIRKALGWSKRAMELWEGEPGWANYAGTHAHLLYANNRRPEAIKVAGAAVAKADSSAAPVLKAALEAMKSGRL